MAWDFPPNLLKQTQVYQEAFAEGEHRGELKAKLETIPELIGLGLSLEQIAGALKLPLEVVQQTSQLFYEQNLAAFIELLNSQRSLFSPQDLADLERLIVPLPDEIEELSKAIATWCSQEEHSPYLNAMRQERQILSNSALERVSGTNTDTKTPDKQTLQNAINQSSSCN